MSTKPSIRETSNIMVSGLTSHEAHKLLLQQGPNILPHKKGASFLKLFLSQINNPFFYILLFATLVSLTLGDVLDATLIFAILVLNSVLGFWQEYKASRELEALRNLEVLTSRVVRDGKEVEIPSAQIVVGDVVVLEAGDRVPADGELLESFSLQINESALTGESLPVVKSHHPPDNAVFLGTTVVSGRGKFEVLKTGAHTKFGAIAQTLISVEDEPTPLERTLASLGKGLVLGILLTTAAIFMIRIWQGFNFFEVTLSSLALMVAAVPEGLPAVVTLVLALGVRKMYQRKALVKKLTAVESLGSATVICTDKTGTLTKNELKVTHVESKAKQDLLRCAVLCNTSSLVLKEDHGGFDVLGDPTEGALLVWAKECGLDPEFERSEGKLLEEVPFNLQDRMMTTLWQKEGRRVLYAKGAPEAILGKCQLSAREKRVWELKYQKLAKKGLRVLAFAQDSTFLGLVGIADEIRPEAKESLKRAKQAGIKVVMVTGDNELTAKAVAEEVGLIEAGDEVLTGWQLQELTDEELDQRLAKIRIFSRITPLDKLRIIKAYQRQGEIVAVTGDGVNDAPALKQAQVGVAMGKIGTDVAKEASDLVLLDDNFSTLVLAVEQGRLIFSNILKVTKFLLTGNLSELLLIGIASILALPTPLLPTQILWINLVTDGPPALALGFDTASTHLMSIPPQRRKTFLSWDLLKFITLGGITLSIICLGVFALVYQTLDLAAARSATFTSMVILQMMLPFIMRRHHSILSNKKLFGAAVLVVLIQLLILTVPSLRVLFKLD